MNWFQQAASRLRIAAGRLRQEWILAVEATLAATVAWIIATRLLGHPQPFFAPAAALIVLGQARGQRFQRAVEVVFGVAAGVLLADIVVQALGPRSTLTVFTVILLTVILGVSIGASAVTLVQAAVSALYLVVVAPSTEGPVPFRFVDALVGGAVALVASQLIGARHPLAPLVAEARRTLGELASLLEAIGAALDQRDEPAAVAALARARQLDAAVGRLQTAVLAAGEALRLHVGRQRHIGRVRTLDASMRQVDYAARNIRVLARAGVTLTRLPTAVPAELGVALRLLAEAVNAAGEALVAELSERDEAAQELLTRTDTAALDAVRIAGQLLARNQPLPIVMIVGQVRAAAIDLLRWVGEDDVLVLSRVDEALGLPPV